MAVVTQKQRDEDDMDCLYEGTEDCDGNCIECEFFDAVEKDLADDEADSDDIDDFDDDDDDLLIEDSLEDIEDEIIDDEDDEDFDDDEGEDPDMNV